MRVFQLWNSTIQLSVRYHLIYWNMSMTQRASRVHQAGVMSQSYNTLLVSPIMQLIALLKIDKTAKPAIPLH